MAQYNVPPTKTNLLRLKEELKFANLGYDLLDQKRNILIVELLNLVDQTVLFQEKVDDALSQAFDTLSKAILKMGKLKVQNIAGAVNIEANIKIKSRRVMGVILPVVETSFEEHSPFFSLQDTSFWIDDAFMKFKEALGIMGKFAELKISVIRLSSEVQRTIRKVNALEKIAIPDLEETVAYVQNRLEENEREMFMLMKLVKEKLEAKRSKKIHDSGEIK